MIFKLRKNASSKTINKAIVELRRAWEDNKTYSGTYYLQIGDCVRYGYNNGFWAWGDGEQAIDLQIAGQKEYAQTRVCYPAA